MSNRFIWINVLVLALGLLVLGLWYFGVLGTVKSGSTGQAKVRIGSSVINAELAVTPSEKARGLSYRDSLPMDGGMLFLASVRRRQTFWMKGMRFPLDFIWIDGDTVADITENVPPPDSVMSVFKTYSPNVPVNKVLEVNAGYVRQHGIKIGDMVDITSGSL